MYTLLTYFSKPQRPQHNDVITLYHIYMINDETNKQSKYYYYIPKLYACFIIYV